MNRQQVKAYCSAKPEAVLEYPFGDDVAVYKIRGKIFALVPEVANRLSVSLKCEPNRAAALRDIYPAVTAGYHLNKKHWNTVLLDGSLPTSEIEIQIDHSYFLVFSGLRKADRNALLLRFGEDALRGYCRS